MGHTHDKMKSMTTEPADTDSSTDSHVEHIEDASDAILLCDDLLEVNHLLIHASGILRLTAHKVLHPRLEACLPNGEWAQHLIDCLHSLEQCEYHVREALQNRDT